MARQLQQIRGLQAELNVPVVCAGDIFDRWNSPPELINFAWNWLPECLYAVPGQHDLPFHDPGEIDRSAYGVLVNSRRLRHIDNPIAMGGDPTEPNLRLHGFGWNVPLVAMDDKWRDGAVNLAVVHRYAWTSQKNSHPEAHKRDHAYKLGNFGYDAYVFGDNHKGFHFVTQKGNHFLNCGSMMRRNVDQKDYEPQIGVLYADGQIETRKLNCSEDLTIGALGYVACRAADRDWGGFIDAVNEESGENGLDFRDTFRRMVNSLKKGPLKQSLLSILGEL